MIGLASVPAALARAEGDDIARQPWFEARTTHFNIYSCGAKQEVYQLAARLEQFRDAYGLLAGAQAVSSPPIIVMAFPDQAALEPFLPLYQGKPANLSGFFKRSSDENLIVLALSGTNAGSMQTIFHEYTHLLFRRNDRVWPLWLQEGMAEIYSTFEAAGRGARIGKPINYHLLLLTHSELMPLKELLAVTHDSPQYNEMEHQGVFYAESWLLTHFLMNGDNPVLKARFGQFTKLLRQGQTTEAAFTNALGMPLTAVEAELRRYLARGQFASIACVVAADLSAPRQVATRPIAQVETCFRLGNELMRIGRLDDAEPFFARAQKIAPASPLAGEGLGLLAVMRDQHEEAARQLKESLEHDSTSFLANYFYAKERFFLTSDGQGRYTHVQPEPAADIRARLQQAITLMPSFAPAHELLGFFELVQGEHPAMAAEQLQNAIQLEPENQWYLLPLAEAQAMNQDATAARRTLAPLREPHVEAKLREQAEETLKEIEQNERKTQ
ncbi:MAG: repeat-containing protein [Pedosphaera sp.]|nr:repeat-containing protein [Pedosphaera sp.]